jgi:shikimate kinase
MNIVLTGFMGTGKTAVGRHLADVLRVPFIDVDTAITKKAGESIQTIFAAQGEAAFRRLESSVIAEVAEQDKTVIATGGGALLDPKNRENLQKNGVLVCLTAKMGTLLDRLKDDLTRPLLAGENLADRVERLMKERQSVYNLCPVQIDTDGKTIAQVAQDILQKVSPRWPN